MNKTHAITLLGFHEESVFRSLLASAHSQSNYCESLDRSKLAQIFDVEERAKDIYAAMWSICRFERCLKM
jgi:hypothetical protein